MSSIEIIFEDPKTGKTKKAPLGFSWLTLFVGFINPLIRGDVFWAFLMLLAMVCTAGVSMLVFPFIYNKIYIKGLVKKGFRANSTDNALLSLASKKLGFRLPVLDPAQIKDSTEQWTTEIPAEIAGGLLDVIKRHKIVSGIILVPAAIFSFFVVLVVIRGGDPSTHTAPQSASASEEVKTAKVEPPPKASSTPPSASNAETFTCFFTESAVLKQGLPLADQNFSERQQFKAKLVYTLQIADGITDTSAATGQSSKALGYGLRFQGRRNSNAGVFDDFRGQSTEYLPAIQKNVNTYSQGSLSRFSDGTYEFMYIWWSDTDPDKHLLFSSCNK